MIDRLTDGHARASRSQILAAFASIYLIWGSTYLAIRYAVQTIPPFIMGGLRFVVSGALLYAWARYRGAPRPTRLHWRNATIAGGLLLLGGNGAVVWAEQFVPSGLTALLVSILPFWLVIIEWVRPPRRRPHGAVVIGLIIGFIGIVVLVGPANIGGHGDVRPIGALVLILGSLSWAIGSFFSRDADLPRSGLLTTGMEMLGGGILMLIAGAVSGELAHFDVRHISGPSAAGLIYLITFGSLLGFTSYIWLLDKVTPARLGTYAYVNPVVAVILGWAIAHETLSLRTAVAAAIVICAVALITTARSSRTAQSA
ncbi:MAG TPA: EamA family transporter [Gemmatimonadaceae bacterium]|nr:EamA family transporter [Gemmatimonadaceae bacterium]